MTQAPRFLQIHTLTPYAAVLLNRDDVGMAKRLPFGGAERTRISSQCLKRHWRRTVDDWSLENLGQETGDALSVRSRQIFIEQIAEPLEQEGFDADRIVLVLEELQNKLLGLSKKAEKSRKEKAEKAAKTETESKSAEERFRPLKTEQVIVLGRPEIDYITATARRLLRQDSTDKELSKEVETFLKANRANLEALRRAAGLDAALFGRMVTSDILARGDAAVHVAHAFTVHGSEAEPDYFTAVDDLVQEAGELGSGHINQSELTSGLFYGYVVIDLPLLVSNLEGCEQKDWESADRRLAGRVVEHLIHLIATVSPGAKLGSTAPYSYAEAIVIEAGSRQPRSLANAFLRPVPVRGDLRANAMAALGSHLEAFDKVYKQREQRRIAALQGADLIPAEDAQSLDDLAGWAAGIAAGAPT